MDNPLTALDELNRVCKDGEMLIIPTYMNKDSKGKTSGFAGAVGKAGADFRRQFTVDSYRQFFLDAGYPDVKVSLAGSRGTCDNVPGAVCIGSKKVSGGMRTGDSSADWLQVPPSQKVG